MTDTTTTPDLSPQTTLYLPLVTAFIRWALTLAGARLGLTGLASSDNVTMLVGSALAAAPLAWSFYQKNVAHRRLLVAAAAPASASAQAQLDKP